MDPADSMTLLEGGPAGITLQRTVGSVPPRCRERYHLVTRNQVNPPAPSVCEYAHHVTRFEDASSAMTPRRSRRKNMSLAEQLDNDLPELPNENDLVFKKTLFGTFQFMG